MKKQDIILTSEPDINDIWLKNETNRIYNCIQHLSRGMINMAVEDTEENIKKEIKKYLIKNIK